MLRAENSRSLSTVLVMLGLMPNMNILMRFTNSSRFTTILSSSVVQYRPTGGEKASFQALTSTTQLDRLIISIFKKQKEDAKGT